MSLTNLHPPPHSDSFSYLYMVMTNDVNEYISLFVRISHIIRNHHLLDKFEAYMYIFSVLYA
jgi:hypothetical protein